MSQLMLQFVKGCVVAACNLSFAIINGSAFLSRRLVDWHPPKVTLLGRIRIPEMVANVTFGGPRRNRLFITATTSLYAVYVAAVGAQWP